jgi:predicted GNAT family acetyltransferase
MERAEIQSHVKNNAAANQFEVAIDGMTAFTAYSLKAGRIILIHTQVPPELEGQGVGNALARASLDYARSEGLRVVPRCAFISAFIRRHNEYQDLVDGAF